MVLFSVQIAFKLKEQLQASMAITFKSFIDVGIKFLKLEDYKHRPNPT